MPCHRWLWISLFRLEGGQPNSPHTANLAVGSFLLEASVVAPERPSLRDQPGRREAAGRYCSWLLRWASQRVVSERVCESRRGP